MTDSSRTVSISIPLDAEPGDTLSFEIDGTKLELVVPIGCQPGDVLQVQLAEQHGGGYERSNSSSQQQQQQLLTNDEDSEDENNNDENEEESSTVSIRLTSGKDLILSSTMISTSRCNIADQTSSSNTTSSQKRQSESNDYDGTHAMVWQAGHWLVDCLTQDKNGWRERLMEEWHASLSSNHHTHDDSASMRVLELGSGLGAVGMVFGCEILGKVSSSLSSVHLVLTDVPAAMPLLQYNLQQHLHLFPSRIHVSARPLIWTLSPPDENDDDSINNPIVATDSASTAPSPPTAYVDWIIGSDLLYNAESIPALVNTMGRYLHPTRGRVLLAVRWRKPDLERRFFQQTTDRFHWQWEFLQPPPSSSSSSSTNIMCPLSWQDFGDAACDISNLYFHSTCVAVSSNDNISGNRTNNNTIKALCEISSNDVEAMSDEEFQAWERAHIQFYLARPRDPHEKRR